MGQQDQEDGAIIEVAREVAGKLGISKFDLKRVLWVGRGQSDECQFVGRHFNVLVLPKALKGSLRPEEWTPLIASSLIRSRTGGKLMRRAVLRRLVLPSSLVGLVLVVVAWSFAREQWTLFVLEAAGAVSTAVLSLLFAPEAKKAALIVDRRAAEVVGRESFLRVLQKIDGMGLKDVEKLKRGGLRARFKPSMTERIENLRSITGTAAT